MLLDISTLAAIVAACVACGAAVFSVLFARRGGDAELKTDLEELALLVERMAKTQRREKMARVRSASQNPEVPSASQPVDFPANPKDQIRARLAQLRG